MSAPIPVTETGALASFLSSLRVARAMPIPGASLVPVLDARGDNARVDNARGDDAPSTAPMALLLEEALASGHTRVLEVCDGGEVNLVDVDHRGELPLLVLDGEQIHGAKQDRIFNASFVVAPQTRVTLPVSCIERGRWRHRTAEFGAAGSTLHAAARSRKLRRICASLASDGRYEADQQAVWRDVRAYLASTHVHSRTEAYAEAVEAARPATDGLLRHLRPSAHQVGVALVRHDRLRILDLFGSAALYARAHDTVLRGLLAALAPARREIRHAPTDIVDRALRRLLEAQVTETASPASSATYGCSTRQMAFTATLYEDRIYHCVMTEGTEETED